MKRLFCGVVLLLALGLAAGCGSSSPKSSGGGSAGPASTAGKPLKVAFVYIQQANDNGWDQAWEDTRKTAEAEFGSKIQTTIKESVPAGPQVRQVLDGLIQDGNKLIFLTAFDYGQFAMAEAKAHPDVDFVQDGWRPAPGLPNMSGFDLAVEDGFYALGMAAAAVSPHAKIGAIGPFPIPQVLRELNALELGARVINPSATVNGVLTNSWFDPAKDRQAVTGLQGSGSEVIANILADPTIPQTAVKSGLPWVGINDPRLGPTSYVLSALYAFDPVVLPAIRAALSGNWRSTFGYVGLKAGTIKLAAFGPYFEAHASAADKAKIAQRIAAIRAGGSVFAGPLQDASGKTVVPAGAQPSVAQLESMNYLVGGVSGVKVG